MRTPETLSRSLRVGSVLAVTVLVLLAPASVAQTPEATPLAGAGNGPHPAHIHSGTCDALGEVVHPLTELTDPAGGGERMGVATARGVKISETVVDASLQEIIDGGHAINVHQSAQAIDVYIACGDIGGALIADEGGRTELVIALSARNDSGHVGVAWLGADGEQTEVVVVLIEAEGME